MPRIQAALHVLLLICALRKDRVSRWMLLAISFMLPQFEKFIQTASHWKSKYFTEAMKAKLWKHKAGEAGAIQPANYDHVMTCWKNMLIEAGFVMPRWRVA